MTVYEPNSDVQPTGEEAAEFIEASPEERRALQEAGTNERPDTGVDRNGEPSDGETERDVEHSPSPHPGKPDRRDATSVERDEEHVRRGIAAPEASRS